MQECFSAEEGILYLRAQPCQNALKGKLIEFPLLACMVEVQQLLYIGEAYARLLAKDI